MTEFTISHYKRAEKELESFHPEEALLIMDEIDRFLANSPFPERKRKKKMHGV